MLAGDDESLIQAFKAIEETRDKQYAPQIISILTSETLSRVRISAVKCLGALVCVESIPLMLGLYTNADLELRQNIEKALVRMGHTAIPELSQYLESNDIDIWYLSVMSLSSLDNNCALAASLSQSCSRKLNSFYNISNIPVLLEKEGLKDLSGLYRLRLKEDYEHIQEACWNTLSISIDPLIISRLKDSLDEDLAGDRREQAIELLSEQSRRHSLIADMLHVLYENSLELSEQPIAPRQSLKNSILAFPDPWLNRFSNYAIAQLEKGGS